MKNIMMLVLVFLITGCVTEQTGTPFKEPTPEGLDKAADYYVDIAYQLAQRKQYEPAMLNIKKAMEKSPNSVRAHLALAEIYQSQGDASKAKKAFRQVLRMDSKYSPAHMAYGRFLFEQKDYEDACESFEKAAADDFYAERSAAFANLGVCYRATGDEVAAEAAMKRSLTLNEKGGLVLLDLSELKFDQKQFPESKQYFDLHVKHMREASTPLTPRALWLGIRLERRFGNADAEASFALFLKNTYPYSREYLEYQESLSK